MNEKRNNVNRARVKTAQRKQVEWRPMALDELLEAEHPARALWAYIEAIDLGILYDGIKAVEGTAGREAVDPKILTALWMLATIQGVSSARHLGRLCETDAAYRWICGGVGVNYHLLSDFRGAMGDFLDQLLTDTVATLMHQNLVTLDVVAQDGVRVRADAGSSSFRREKTLRECRDEAERQVRRLREERDDESRQGDGNARREATRRQVAENRLRRVEQALAELKTLREQKEQRCKGDGDKARCSTTDPEARVMKMGDGGFRPAYNVQLATDGGARIIVAVEVVNSGSDRGQLAPMQEHIQARYNRAPKHHLVDAGYSSHDDVAAVERRGTQVLAPIFGEEPLRKRGVDPHQRQRRDTDETFAFRQRMATPEAKTLFKKRGSIAEFPNAVFRNHGLDQFPVRGLVKAKSVALLHAVCFNFQRLLHLGLLPHPQ